MTAPPKAANQRIPFAAPATARGLHGCTGVARLTLCICCDRLYQPGNQMAPAAMREKGGVYRCKNQVIDGAHVGSLGPAGSSEQPPVPMDNCNEQQPGQPNAKTEGHS